jgi:hypothetical protein
LPPYKYNEKNAINSNKFGKIITTIVEMDFIEK